MESPSAKDFVWIYVKGMAMGAADIVPGVSGGTVAFITGIYERLIDSIGAMGPKTIGILLKQGPLAAWRSVDGNFLLTLMLGILTGQLLLGIGTVMTQVAIPVASTHQVGAVLLLTAVLYWIHAQSDQKLVTSN